MNNNWVNQQKTPFLGVITQNGNEIIADFTVKDKTKIQSGIFLKATDGVVEAAAKGDVVVGVSMKTHRKDRAYTEGGEILPVLVHGGIVSIAVTGDIKKGQYIVSGDDGIGEVADNGIALAMTDSYTSLDGDNAVDIILMLGGIASSGGGTGGVSQAQVDSSIKAVTDPIITRVSKNETDIKALQDAGTTKQAVAIRYDIEKDFIAEVTKKNLNMKDEEILELVITNKQPTGNENGLSKVQIMNTITKTRAEA